VAVAVVVVQRKWFKKTHEQKTIVFTVVVAVEVEFVVVLKVVVVTQRLSFKGRFNVLNMMLSR